MATNVVTDKKLVITASDTEIRKAKDKDTLLLSALGTVTFFEAYFEQDDPGDLANYLAETFSPEAVRSEMEDPNAEFYICFYGGHAVGYAKLLRDSRSEGLMGKNPIELKRIYLVERVWGNGFGKLLLEHCEAEARDAGHDTLWLGVWQENRRGQSFYAKHGFSKVGTITFPYGESVGINDVMEKRL